MWKHHVASKMKVLRLSIGNGIQWYNHFPHIRSFYITFGFSYQVIARESRGGKGDGKGGKGDKPHIDRGRNCMFYSVSKSMFYSVQNLCFILYQNPLY